MSLSPSVALFLHAIPFISTSAQKLRPIGVCHVDRAGGMQLSYPT